jgi:hypothetical protein
MSGYDFPDDLSFYHTFTIFNPCVAFFFFSGPMKASGKMKKGKHTRAQGHDQTGYRKCQPEAEKIHGQTGSH